MNPIIRLLVWLFRDHAKFRLCRCFARCLAFAAADGWKKLKVNHAFILVTRRQWSRRVFAGYRMEFRAIKRESGAIERMTANRRKWAKQTRFEGLTIVRFRENPCSMRVLKGRSVSAKKAYLPGKSRRLCRDFLHISIMKKIRGWSALPHAIAVASFMLASCPANAQWTFTNLHSFSVFPDGAVPLAGLVQGADGDLYGTTSGGGTNGGNGTVFKVTTNGLLSVLHEFTGGPDGGNPQAGLLQGNDGSFYGTTYTGGTNNFGNIFKITTDGTLTSLYSFTNGADGANPNSPLAQGGDGSFYGTTSEGQFFPNEGGFESDGSGTIFRVTTNGAFTTLHYFIQGNDGPTPNASALALGRDGNFYGVVREGGANRDGNVFRISPDGSFTNLYSFTGGADGVAPVGLVLGTDGNFYGTGNGGANFGFGTVFQITPGGLLNTLYTFTGFAKGAYLQASLVEGTDGSFYGTTEGGGTIDDCII